VQGVRSRLQPQGVSKEGTRHVYEEQQLQASPCTSNSFTNLASLSTRIANSVESAFSRNRWKFVIDTAFPVEKDAAMKSSLDQFLTQFMDQAQRMIGPDALDSVESMVAYADRVGQGRSERPLRVEGHRAEIIVMPKRRRSKK